MHALVAPDAKDGGAEAENALRVLLRGKRLAGLGPSNPPIAASVVELGRALAANPKILLLDEPMGGMNIEEKEDMCRYVLDVVELTDTAVILIEHDMGVVMDISDYVVVLDQGTKIGEGTPEEVRSNQAVIDAYLGASHLGIRSPA